MSHGASVQRMLLPRKHQVCPSMDHSLLPTFGSLSYFSSMSPFASNHGFNPRCERIVKSNTVSVPVPEKLQKHAYDLNLYA
jgi:hypothetical protein